MKQLKTICIVLTGLILVSCKPLTEEQKILKELKKQRRNAGVLDSNLSIPIKNLVINTPQFFLSAPGKWQQQEPKSANTLYVGTNEENRRITISAHPFSDDVKEENRYDVTVELVTLYKEAEEELGEGKVEIYPEETVREGKYLVGGYRVLQPSRGRVGFVRVIGDHEKAFNIYYEIFGINQEPDIKLLYGEFLRIINTVTLKETDPGLGEANRKILEDILNGTNAPNRK